MIEVRPLSPEDDRTGFRSGNPDLDRFFHKYAGQNQFRHYIGVTLVAVDGEKILGYATIFASTIEIEKLPGSRRKKLPAYPLPVLRLARLAVDESAQGKGVGKKLLRTVFERAREMAGTVGCCGVVVDAKSGTRSYYLKLGFEEVELVAGQLGDKPQPTPMFLALNRLPKS